MFFYRRFGNRNIFVEDFLLQKQTKNHVSRWFGIRRKFVTSFSNSNEWKMIARDYRINLNSVRTKNRFEFYFHVYTRFEIRKHHVSYRPFKTENNQMLSFDASVTNSRRLSSNWAYVSQVKNVCECEIISNDFPNSVYWQHFPRFLHFLGRNLNSKVKIYEVL